MVILLNTANNTARAAAAEGDGDGDDRAGNDDNSSFVTSSTWRSDTSNVVESQPWTLALTTASPDTSIGIQTTVIAIDVTTMTDISISESTSDAAVSANNVTDRQHRTGIDGFVYSETTVQFITDKY